MLCDAYFAKSFSIVEKHRKKYKILKTRSLHYKRLIKLFKAKVSQNAK
jgi:hypothetical protein